MLQRWIDSIKELVAAAKDDHGYTSDYFPMGIRLRYSRLFVKVTARSLHGGEVIFDYDITACNSFNYPEQRVLRGMAYTMEELQAAIDEVAEHGFPRKPGWSKVDHE